MRPPYFVLAAALAAVCFVAPTTLNAQAAAAATATVNCKDGTTSKAGRGACGHHGGVLKSGTAPTTAPSSAPVAAAAATPSPEPKTTPKPAAAATTTHTAVASTGSASSKSTGKSETTDPAGAIAKCKDGLYSHSKVRKGACSRHGGVAQWMQQ